MAMAPNKHRPLPQNELKTDYPHTPPKTTQPHSQNLITLSLYSTEE